MPRASSARHRPNIWLTMLLCVVVAMFAAACGHEGTTGAPPLGERSENAVPLNPPTLRFHVSTTGAVDASPDLEAETGEAVAVVLENESDTAYELRIVDPSGDQVFETSAAPGGRGDGRAMPRTVGEHVVQVSPVDDPEAAEEFVVDVFES